MSLAEALERAAAALPDDADEIRPANGDAFSLLGALSEEAALRVLCWILAHEPVAAEELAGSWAEDEQGVALLAGFSEEGLPKAGRKILRRIQHRLRSAGVEVRGAPAAPTVARLGKVEEEFGGGFLSLPDPQGVQLVFLVESTPHRGARIFEALLDPGLGVLKLSTYETGRSDARQFLRAAEKSRHGSLVSAETDAVKALLLCAASRQGPERSLSRSYIQWRHCFEVPEGTLGPGQRAVAEMGTIESAESLEAAAELLATRLGPWAPAEGLAARAVEEAQTAFEAGEGGEAARTAALECGAAILLEDETRGCLAARFREAAYVFWRRGEEKDARACAAAVTCLEKGQGAAGCVERAFVEGVLASIFKPAEDAGLDMGKSEHQNRSVDPELSAEENS